MSRFSRKGIELPYLGWSTMTWWLCVFVSCWYMWGVRLNGDNWKTVVGSDGGGYYAYLPAVFIYHDYQYNFAGPMDQTYHPFINPTPAYYCHPVDGKLVNKYYCGESICLLPFFLTATALSHWFDYPVDGYSFLFQGAVCIGALFYVLLGLWMVRKILLRYGVSEGATAATLAALFLGTNLFHYCLAEPSMSHAYSFGIIAWFVWQLVRFCETPSTGRMALLGFLLGLIILIRPSNGMVILILPFIAGSWEHLKKILLYTVRNWLGLLLAAASFCAIMFVQLRLYKEQCGHWFLYSYPGEHLDFAKPELMNVLFSWRKGFFIYTPVMLFAMAGLITLARKPERYKLATLGGFLLLAMYVISCWSCWPYGGSFGMRPLVDYYVFFSIPLALLIDKVRTRWMLISSATVLSALIFLNLFQFYQYYTNILPFDEMTWTKYKRIFLKSGMQYQYMYYPGDTHIPPEPPNGSHRVSGERYDYEHPIAGFDSSLVVLGQQALSGKGSMRLDDKHHEGMRHSLNVVKYVPDSLVGKAWMKVEGRAWLDDYNTNAVLIICFVNQGQAYYWNGWPLIHQIDKEKSWQKFGMNVKIPPIKGNGDDASAFILKTDGRLVYIDDFDISFWVEP